MDVKTVELLMDRSEKTVVNFFQKLHDSLKTEIADVIRKNVELRRSLEFTQDKLDEATEVIRRHEAKFRQLSENSGMKLSPLILQTKFIINFPTRSTKFMTGFVSSGHIKLKCSIETNPTLRAT